MQAGQVSSPLSPVPYTPARAFLPENRPTNTEGLQLVSETHMDEE